MLRMFYFGIGHILDVVFIATYWPAMFEAFLPSLVYEGENIRIRRQELKPSTCLSGGIFAALGE